MDFKLKHFAYFCLIPGLPDKNIRVDQHFEAVTLSIVAFNPDFLDAFDDVVQALFSEGVGLFEFCGGFSFKWVERCKKLTKERIPVGVSLYDSNDRVKLLQALWGDQIFVSGFGSKGERE